MTRKITLIEIDELKQIISDAVKEAVKDVLDNYTKPADRVLSKKQAAEYLNISIGTLDTLTSTEQLPCVRIGRNPKYLQKDLDEFLKDSKL